MTEPQPNEELMFADVIDYLDAAKEVAESARRDLMEMDLSDEQRTEVAELVSQFREALAPFRRRLEGES